MEAVQNKLRYSARGIDRAGADYLPAEQFGLCVSAETEGGSGALTDPVRLRLRVTNPTDTVWRGVLKIELPLAGAESRFWLPGLFYGRNRGEAPLRVDNRFPRLRRGTPELPAADAWMVRSDQLSHPAAFAIADGRLWGLGTAPYYIRQDGKPLPWQPGLGLPKTVPLQFTGFSCRLGAAGQDSSIGVTLGYEYAPWHFIQSHTIRDRAPLGDNCIELAPGEELPAVVELYAAPAADPRCLYDAIRTVYERWYEPPRRVGSPRQAVRELAAAVSRDAWLPEKNCYAGFVFDNFDGTFPRRELPSQTWTNGLVVAVPLLLAAQALHDEALRAQALACIEAMTPPASLNPANDLPFACLQDGVWSNRGWWFDGMHNAGHAGYLVGQAVYYLLKAYQSELRFDGTRHADWLAYAARVLAAVQPQKNADGEYPYLFSEATGAGIEYDALGSAWCLAAQALYALITDDRTLLPELAASERHYYEAFVAKAECYGGPLDTDKAVDSEGVLALIRAEVCLHRLTGEESYLDHLRDALCYEFSYQFCYNTPVSVPPLATVGWSSCGGCITSTCNPHIHPMTCSVAGEIAYYLAQRNDDYIARRLEDLLRWGCQSYNLFDGQYDYGKTGWMSERFCYSEGLLTERYPDGRPASTWFALMPWAAASVIEGEAEAGGER